MQRPLSRGVSSSPGAATFGDAMVAVTTETTPTVPRNRPGGTTARDRFPDQEVWPALYTALAQHIALGERIRHTTARALSAFDGQRISHLSVRLSFVLDGCETDGCLTSAWTEISHDDLCHPADYRKTRAIAEATRVRGIEGMLIPSCTRFRGGSLIICPDLLRPSSEVRVIGTEDPDLFVHWDHVI
jgi:RES domain